jgi:hypothetical protein
MQFDRVPARTLAMALARIALSLAATPVFAAPTVQQVSGALDHNATITITGSGFGSKPTSAPVVWDNASGRRMSDKWDGAWPDKLPGYNTQYYGPMRGVQPPHEHDTRFIAGAHAANTGADSGYAVVFYKDLSVDSSSYIYVSWYQVGDRQWAFGGDNNFKTFVYSVCCGAYHEPYWYTMYGPPHPTSNSDKDMVWAINGQQLSNPDSKGHNAWWKTAVNPMAGQWSKVEMAIKVSSQADGYVKQWENGRLVMDYSGPTDTWSGNRRTVAIGGYARMQGFTSNWRYFDDVYIDTTLARVVLADKPVLSEATIIENQLPTSWSDGSITANVNLGKFTQGQTAYLIVVDASGTPSSTGTAVTAGGTVAQPSAPPSVSVD